VKEESTLNEDILVEKFYESYNNLTVKSLMMLKFSTQMFVNTKFIFKVNRQGDKFA
jgi:beta-1,3-galactosyltransferase 1